jgi:Zn-dependent protease
LRFTLFGFPVTVESTVLVLAGIYLLFGLQSHTPVLEVGAWIAVVFSSILVHEMGHAFAAQRFQLTPIAITLHGFGGLTSHRRSNRAWKDLVVSLAGPGAGLLLGCFALLLYWKVPAGGIGATVVRQVMYVNIFWSLFNLLPLSPLDGGKALSAVLLMAVPRVAWQITWGVGLVGGAALAIYALAVGQSLFLLFIGGSIVMHNLQNLRAWRGAVG